MPGIGAMTRVRHALSAQVHQFFDRHGFFWQTRRLSLPATARRRRHVPSVNLDQIHRDHGNELTADPFKQDFFGGEAFLTVSGQLNLEASPAP